MIKNYKLESTSMWSFPDRGNWEGHDSSYPGNWSPHVVRNIILRYSKENDLLLDQFVGGGTSILESIILNRNIIGIDINRKALEKVQSKISNLGKSKVRLINADSRNIYFIGDNSIDLILTHPPYLDIIRYSKDIKEDLSRMTERDFLYSLEKVAKESYRVLKNNRFCVILIGDVRKKGLINPIAFKTMNTFIRSGFELKEIVIKKQHNARKTMIWKKKNPKSFLLIEHEYLFVFQKRDTRRSL